MVARASLVNRLGKQVWTPNAFKLFTNGHFKGITMISNSIFSKLLITLLLATLAGCGSGTNTPADVDGDGVPDSTDTFPNDPAESVDTDGDTVGDNGDNYAHEHQY